jgi:hypothetical protein
MSPELDKEQIERATSKVQCLALNTDGATLQQFKIGKPRAFLIGLNAPRLG